MTRAPGMGVRAALRQSQRLALTPSLRHSLDILRMPLADLTGEVAREEAENPFLKVTWPRVGADGAGGDAFDLALRTVAARPSLVEDLRRQLALRALPARVVALADYLAGDLREDGYLDTSLEEHGALTGAESADLEAALAAIQSCEPAGIGARDLRECLTLQLRDHGLAETVTARVLDNLGRFGAADDAALARVLGLPEAEARRIAGIVRGLRARPVAPDGPGAVAPLLAPDLEVRRDNRGAMVVSAARRGLPELRLDEALLARAGQGEFADRCRARAVALIGALARRVRTLERIGAALVEAQHRFFALGPEHLVALSRADLARKLELHPSTVGRAVAGKAIDHDGRLLPLEMFFSPPVSAAARPGQDDVVAASVARLALARIVAREDPLAPLSDAAICARLRAEGVDITRRTVAKYRGCLAIPSSYERLRSVRRRGPGPRIRDGSPTSIT